MGRDNLLVIELRVLASGLISFGYWQIVPVCGVAG